MLSLSECEYIHSRVSRDSRVNNNHLLVRQEIDAIDSCMNMNIIIYDYDYLRGSTALYRPPFLQHSCTHLTYKPLIHNQRHRSKASAHLCRSPVHCNDSS